jgi:hypothetical protein
MTGRVRVPGGNASTSIIDTSLYGDITIEVTLAPSDVLMLSPVTPALVSYASATSNETGIATTVGTAPALTASQGTGYTLSDMGLLQHDVYPASAALDSQARGIIDGRTR